MTKAPRASDVNEPLAAGSPANGPPGSTAADDHALAGLDLGPLVWRSRSVIAVATDEAGVIRDANPTFERLARRDPRGEPLDQFVGPGQIDAFAGWLSTIDAAWATHTWGMLPDDDHIPRDVRLAATRRPDRGIVLVGEPIEREDLTAALLDVNETILEEQRRLTRDGQRLGRAAQVDALTGISNRRALDARLAEQVALARPGAAFAIVMLDLDHFKGLNDQLGHQAGDAVLTWLGAHLGAAARRGDVVARYGGEEFMAVLPGADGPGARRWAERLRAALEVDPAPGIDRRVTASMGVAEWRAGDTAIELIARADRAMYAAKRSGRDRIVSDGVEEPSPAAPADRAGPLLSMPSIALATIDGATVRGASEAFAQRVGGQPVGQPAVQLVHPDQAASFGAYVAAANDTWAKAVFGFQPDARGIPVDHHTWVRRRFGVVELLIEPAVAERVAVDETLLALVDDLIEIQRELQLRTAALERAGADRSRAEVRMAALERLLPICAWCGRIRTGDPAANAWVDVSEYLEGEGVSVTHGMCDSCEATMAIGLGAPLGRG